MKFGIVEVALFILGWLLFVAAQAYNSVRSTANGLSGWAGYRAWLSLQSINLATRAFFSAIFYGTVIQFVAQKIQSTGLTLHAYSIAGVAGYSANALLYQFFGLVPWLRVEISDLAPPTTTNPPKGTNP